LHHTVHVIGTLTVLELSFELAKLRKVTIWSHLLLHLELDVVENPVKVHWIELDRHLHSWILLEVDHGGIALLLVDHGCRSLDLLPLFWCDLLAVKDQ